jgi:hypothetical protein
MFQPHRLSTAPRSKAAAEAKLALWKIVLTHRPAISLLDNFEQRFGLPFIASHSVISSKYQAASARSARLYCPIWVGHPQLRMIE